MMDRGQPYPAPMLIKSTVLFCALALTCEAVVFDRNYTRPYVLKRSWVENFIKFQYIFEGKQGKAKIVPLGCVPSNEANGTMLKAGGQFHGHDFVFTCAEGDGGILSYEAIACVDAFGAEMRIGETRRLSNGTVILHCNIFGGALKKVVERAAGCYFNQTIYGEDLQWVEPILVEADKKASTSSNSQMTARLMKCFRPHYSYYESHVVGCVVGRLGILIDEFAELDDGSVVKCVENNQGTVGLAEAHKTDLSCTMDNVTHSHRDRWVEEKRAAEMECNFGHIMKTGCFLDNSSIPIGQELKISNGCVFLCHPQTNVYMCDTKLGNFTIVEQNRKEEMIKKLVF